MSFDFQALMQGFLETKTADIQERKQEARNYKDRMRAIADRNAAIAQQRTSMYTSSKAMGDQLLKLGATPDLIQAALKSGQDGLTNLYKTVQSVNTKLGPEEAKSFLSSPDVLNYDLGGAQGVGTEGLDQLYKTTVGLPTGAKIGDYKAPDTTFVDKLFGKEDYTAKAKAQLDEEQGLYGGYSVYDLTTIGTLPDYMAGSQGEIFTISAPKIYTSEFFAEEASAISKSLDALKDNPSYVGAVKRLEAVEGKLAGLDKVTKADDYKEALARVEVAKAEINGMLSDAIRLPMTTQGASYYNSADYYTQMAGQVANTLGFVPEWLQEEIEAAKVADEVVKQAGGGGLAQAQDDTAAALGTTPKVSTSVEPSYTIDDGEGTAFNVVTMNGVDYVQTQSGTLLGAEASDEIIKATKGAAQEEVKTVKAEPKETPYTLPDVTSPEDKADAARKQATITASEIEDTYGIAVDTTDKVREVSTGAIKTTADFVDRWVLGASVGYMQKPIASVTSGLAFLADKAGFKGLADGLYVAAYDQAKGADDMIEKGFFENLINEVNSSEYPESTFVNGMIDYLQPSIQKPMGEVSEEESTAMLAALKENLSTMYNTFKLERKSGDPKDVEDMRKEYRTVSTVKPDVDFDDPTSVPDSNPRAFSDSPSALDVAPESRVSAAVGTGADRRPNNAGMMSRPAQPKSPDSEAKPKMQDTLSDMVDMGIKVHGARSQTAKLLKKVSNQATRGTRVKVSDITKLIRDTSKLPKTDTRDTLLMQLYELRDTLNNR